ncbi:hypothetical protein C8R44DRAFT_803034 [Mycena epipterygia]|nr:hypothetical protein C8R44DRAFT_803034 [Mycena epipterygia]
MMVLDSAFPCPAMSKIAAIFLSLSLFLPFALASFGVDSVTAKASTCEPLLLQWQGAKKPSTLSIIGTDGTILENLETTEETSFPWKVDIEAGTVVGVQVTDSTGATATSNFFTIQPGSTDCALNNIAEGTGTDTEQSTTSSSSSSTSTEAATQPPTPSPSNSGVTTAATQPLAPSPSNSGVPSITPSSTTAALSSPHTISTSQPTTAITSAQPSSSLVASTATVKRTTPVVTVLAVLIPCLILFAILVLCLAHRRKRRINRFSELEGQTSTPRWFDKPAYWRRPGLELDTQEVETPGTRPTVNPAAHPAIEPSVGLEIEIQGAEIQRPALTIATNTVVPAALLRPASGTASLTSIIALPSAQNSISPDSKSPASGMTSTDVGTLQSRIHALMEENAVLATLAAPPQSYTPPPAYV